MSFNVGDKLKLKADHRYCYLGESSDTIAYFKATYLGDGDYMDYKAYDSNDKCIGSCSCWKQYEFELYEHVYKVGDKLVPSQSFRDCGCVSGSADYIEITDVYSSENAYSWRAWKNGHNFDSCSYHEDGFVDPMQYYQEQKPVAVAPEAPTESFVGSGTTTISPDMTVQQSSPTVARIGWYDEPVFIPKAVPEEEPKVGTINIVPVTNPKHSANLRKLIGHRNFKSRVAA